MSYTDQEIIKSIEYGVSFLPPEKDLHQIDRFLTRLIVDVEEMFTSTHYDIYEKLEHLESYGYKLDETLYGNLDYWLKQVNNLAHWLQEATFNTSTKYSVNFLRAVLPIRKLSLLETNQRNQMLSLVKRPHQKDAVSESILFFLSTYISTLQKMKKQYQNVVNALEMIKREASKAVQELEI